MMENSSILLQVDNNVTYIRGRLDSSVYQELKKVLGYYPEDSYWMVKASSEFAGNKKWKNDWDGLISTVCWSKNFCRCSVKKDGTHFPTGLLSKAISFLKSKGIPYSVEDVRLKTPFGTNYSMSKEFEFRDYQQEVINKVVGTAEYRGQDRGIIKMCTGAGKTAVASGIVANISVSPTIFYVPSIDLLEQAKDELERFIKYNGQNIKVGVIGGGIKDIQDINVMTVQTAVRALGGVWVKYDDEEGNRKENFEFIDDNKEEIRELIKDARLMLCDEVQHWASETCQIISDNSINCQYRYGLSVFPDTMIELRGGAFGNGRHISIEEFWKNIENDCSNNIYFENEYQIIDLEDIESRGWNGKNFEWKKVKRLIRHINNRKSYSIRYAGSETVKMTEDHSLFKIDKENILKCSPNQLEINDKLLMDDGYKFEIEQEELSAIDVLSFNPRKMRVGIDLSNVEHSDLNMKKTTFSRLRKKGEIAKKYGGSLYLTEYIKYKNLLPSPEWIYVEGGNNTGISANLKISDIAYLIGFYIGDGWLNETRLNFAVERPFLDKFIKIFDNDTYVKVNPKIRNMKRGSVEVRCACRPLVDFLRYYFKDKKCYEKNIPNSLLYGAEEVKRELLKGLIDSDGSKKKSKEDVRRNRKPISYTTTSKELKDNLCLLLRSLGVSYTVSKGKPQLGGVVDGKQIVSKRISYQVLWSENALEGDNLGRKGKSNGLINCIEKKVLEIKEIDDCEYVYDIEMDGHPSFVANGILVHNSGTPYRSQGDDILIDACFGKQIVDINASYLIRRGFLIKPTIYFSEINNMKAKKRSSYANIYKEGIVENEFRNNRIAQFANEFYKRDRKTLILVKQIAHGNLLENIIPGSIFIHGGTNKKKRLAHLDKMRENEPHITIASVIFDEGINCKPLDSLILAGSGKCVGANTFINSNLGMVTIEELFELLNFKEEKDAFYDVASKSIMSSSHHYKKNLIKKMYMGGKKDCYKITLDNGLSIVATEEHRIRVMRDGRIVYKSLKDIREKDFALVKKGDMLFNNLFNIQDHFNKFENNLSCGRKGIDVTGLATNVFFSKLIGYIICKGNFGSNRSINISNIFTGDDRIIEEISQNTGIDIVKHFFKNRGGPDALSKRGWRYYINSVNFVDFLNKYYFSQRNKGDRVPLMIRMSCKECQRAFLRAVFDSEGSVGKSNIEIIMKGEGFLKEIQLMLLNFGIMSSLKIKKVKEYPENVYYRLFISNVKNIQRFLDEINFDSLLKREKCIKLSLKKYNPNKDVIPGIKKYCKRIRDASKIRHGVDEYRRYNGALVKLSKSSKQEFTKDSMAKFLEFYNDTEGSSCYKYLQKLMSEEISFVEIVDIKKEEKQKVYDLTMDYYNTFDTTFAASGIVTHNSPTRALQRIGRILRPYEGKKDVIAVDFMDNCKFLKAHSEKRKKIYETEEEFDIRSS